MLREGFQSLLAIVATHRKHHSSAPTISGEFKVLVIDGKSLERAHVVVLNDIFQAWK
jgi:hypothetical protein